MLVDRYPCLHTTTTVCRPSPRACMATTLGAVRRAQRADGPAAMLGISTANPAYYVLQDEFPDYYFHITKMEHLTDLKDTFTKLCMYI